MLEIVVAYIAGCNKEQIEEIGKAVIARQDVLRNSYNLRLQELRQAGNNRIVSK